MKKIYIVIGLVVVLAILSLWLLTSIRTGFRDFNPENVSSRINDLCKEKGKIECYADCVDGFGDDCYFDSSLYNKEDLGTGHFIPEEVKEICLAIHSSSVCNQCHNTFELREGDKLVEISCEEFFQKIEDKNQTCNGCVDIIQYGCC